MTDILAPIAGLRVPDEPAIRLSAERALAAAREIVIDGQPMFEIAADELKVVKKRAADLDADRRKLVDPLNAVVKEINARYKPATEFLIEAERIIKGSMLAYQSEQERIAAEAQRKAEEAAAAERRRLEEEARKAREAAEAEQRRLAAIEAERQRAARAEQERIEREAAEARAKGDREAAARAEAAAVHQRQAEAAAQAQAAQQAALVQQNAALEVAAIEQVSQVITAAPVVVAQAKTAGISTAKGHDFEVVDIVALIKDVAAKVDQQPGLAGALKPDEVKLRALVKALGMNLGLKGIRVFEKKTLRAAA